MEHTTMNQLNGYRGSVWKSCKQREIPYGSVGCIIPSSKVRCKKVIFGQSEVKWFWIHLAILKTRQDMRFCVRPSRSTLKNTWISAFFDEKIDLQWSSCPYTIFSLGKRRESAHSRRTKSNNNIEHQTSSWWTDYSSTVLCSQVLVYYCLAQLNTITNTWSLVSYWKYKCLGNQSWRIHHHKS